MKNLFLSYALFLVAGYSGWAQVEKGTHAVGATVSLNRYEASQNFLIRSKTFSFSPEYAYFLDDNWSLMAGGSYTKLTRSLDTSLGNTSEQLEKDFRAFSGIRRHYPLQNQLFLIGTVGLEYTFENSKSEFFRETDRSEAHTKIHEFGIFGNLGLIYFPSDRWSLELIVLETNLHRIRTNALIEDEINNQFNGWAFNLVGKLSSPSLGIRYYFLGSR
ncbi:outer membrane beta-barrel protein [Lunatibacter salilacus]|uniref:outer membrane beta-barrel protein n=1 Tax=Lunatibacter salilacus TaxID=2483804 RepID=UPI00131BC00D|nr:outer membrane beta-barrel protein [Lunatibacter salilacus]